ncbi:MAG TPA: nitronate monooxygenase, partial [Pseudogracilibacillus sp.]|nr:nitronate monooxygenase [Pseudogracilibacillus sp.]
MGHMQTELTKMLEIDYPIIQAPMAGGITSTTLVSESSNNGALGMIGAGYMTANELKQQIQDIKNETKNPFGVNVFVP